LGEPLNTAEVSARRTTTSAVGSGDRPPPTRPRLRRTTIDPALQSLPVAEP
jgi:hypothetical protein